MKGSSPLFDNSLGFNESNFPYGDSRIKYESYLLNENHKLGVSKAKFLEIVLGYSKEDGAALHAAVTEAINGEKPVSIRETEFGIKCVFEVQLKGNGNGNMANVTVVIQMDRGNNHWRIITIFPSDKDK